MKLGIDCLLQDSALRKPLAGRRIALLGHPASLTQNGRHSLDALAECAGLQITAAFGPQHGLRGEKQDNMIETEDFQDPRHAIPVYSLYGKVRRPTQEMLDSFDVLLIDLQDIGTRIYTYIATTAYLLDAAAEQQKAVWVLDRPNPAGRPVEGSFLEEGWESFVGAARLPMRHGLTLGEFARWYVADQNLEVELRVVAMEGYKFAAPGCGWPVGELSWVNPSPNASSLNMARCFAGTVLFEGTWLSEGRGTTTPLEVVGHPELDFTRLLNRMLQLEAGWLEGCLIRPCFFEPTFHKHAGKICSAIQIHTDNPMYKHEAFRPYRLCALLLKSIAAEYPEFEIWRDYHYEYEKERLAIDLLSGSSFLREWVDDAQAESGDLHGKLLADEQRWLQQRRQFLLYE